MTEKCILLSLLILAVCPLSAQKTVLDLSKVKAPEISCHINGKSAKLPPGTEFTVGKEGITLHYNFPSPGHDACMVEFPVELKKFTSFAIRISVPEPGHRPFMVLTDKNGEKHYFTLTGTRRIASQVISRKGTMTLKGEISIANKHPGEYFAFRWGGDDNQRIDFPIKKLMLGLNDSPDTFRGKGKITFHTMTFQ